MCKIDFVEHITKTCLQNVHVPSEIQMDRNEICLFNKKILETSECCMHPILEKEADYFSANRFSAYGICTKDSGIYTEPVSQSPFHDRSQPYYDTLRVTSIKVNTPVLINEISNDGAWFHIVKGDYEGYAACDTIALCRTREEWLDAQKMEQFLLVITPVLSLEVTGQLLTIGTCLPILPKKGCVQDYYQRISWHCITVKFPIRDEYGFYDALPINIPISSGIHIGWLDYSRHNLLTLAFSFLGKAYGWGGSFHSVDCSQLVQDIYACFGMKIPRDSSGQRVMPVDVILFSEDLTEDQRKEILFQLAPGTQLFFPGHTMLYLGHQEQEFYVISAVGSIQNPCPEEPSDLQIRSVVITPLSIRRINGKTWLESLDTVLRY